MKKNIPLSKMHPGLSHQETTDGAMKYAIITKDSQ